MKLSSVLLIDKNVFSKPAKIAVVGTGTYNEQGKTNTGRDFDGYTISCVARRNDTLKVKVPKENNSALISQITDALLDGSGEVFVSFSNLKLKAYAMLVEDNRVLSGISAKADSFQIVAIQEVDEDDDIDF